MSLQMECRKEKRMGGGQTGVGRASEQRTEGGQEDRHEHQLCLRLSPHV